MVVTGASVNTGDHLVARDAHGSGKGKTPFHLFTDTPGRVLGPPPQTLRSRDIHVYMPGPGRFPQGCIMGHGLDQDPIPLFQEYGIGRQHRQVRTESYGSV